MVESPQNTTLLLEQASAGDAKAAAELVLVVYTDLKRRAKRFLRGERPNHTLQPTALVHEAYLRLVDQSRVNWNSKTHFLRIGAMEMRRVLLDHARAHNAAKRGGGRLRVALDEKLLPHSGQEVDALDVLEALEELSALNPRQAQIVEARFFGGLTVRETAQTLGVSATTVENDWRMARAWLLLRLGGEAI